MSNDQKANEQKLNINPSVAVPDAPPEMIEKRDKIVAELEKIAKTSTGTLQQVLRKTASLMFNTRQGAQIDTQLYSDVKEAFLRYSKDTTAGATPPILMDAIEWMSSYLETRGFSPSEPAAAAAATPAPAAASSSAPRPKGPQDGFESGKSAARPMSLGNPDAPPPPNAKPLDPKAEQKELESFKNWMKNPALGKLKG
jgi:hypothetical protein